MNYYEYEDYDYEDGYNPGERQLFPSFFNPFMPNFPGMGHSPGMPPNFPPSGPGDGPSGGQNVPPSTPPPSFTPQQSQFQTKAIDPGGIRGCLFQFTYIWLRRDAFWFYPTFIGRRSISGFRWTGFRWVYFGIDLNQIESFQCF